MAQKVSSKTLHSCESHIHVLELGVLTAELGIPSLVGLSPTVVTRRRDILYGSLRASIQAPSPYQGGTIMRWQAAYNSSDYIATSIYSADEAVNSSYHWTYSDRRHSVSDGTILFRWPDFFWRAEKLTRLRLLAFCCSSVSALHQPALGSWRPIRLQRAAYRLDRSERPQI